MRAVVWRAEYADMHGQKIPLAVLEKAVADFQKKHQGTAVARVGFNYRFSEKTLGTVTALEVDGNDLIADMELDADTDVDDAGAGHFRIGFVATAYHLQERVTIIDAMDVLHVSYVTSPLPLPGDRRA